MGQNNFFFLKEKLVLLFGQCPETRMSYDSPVDGHKGGIFAQRGHICYGPHKISNMGKKWAKWADIFTLKGLNWHFKRAKEKFQTFMHTF